MGKIKISMDISTRGMAAVEIRQTWRIVDYNHVKIKVWVHQH